MSLNLHAIVRPCNQRKQEGIYLLPFFRSEGAEECKGIVTAYYSRQDGYMGQIQSEGDSALYHAELGTQSTVIRKIYLIRP